MLLQEAKNEERCLLSLHWRKPACSVPMYSEWEVEHWSVNCVQAISYSMVWVILV